MIWSARSTPLNALPLLSFHKVHIRHKGAALHAFTLLLPTNVSFHPSKFPLTVECKTHCTSKREKIRFHNILALLQNKKRRSLVSSSSLHKKHLFGMFHPLLFNWSVVKTLFQGASQAKKPTLTGAQDLQIMHQGKGSLEAIV